MKNNKTNLKLPNYMMLIILIPYIYLNKTFKLTQVLNKMLVCKLGLSLTILEKLQEYVYIYIYIYINVAEECKPYDTIYKRYIYIPIILF